MNFSVILRVNDLMVIIELKIHLMTPVTVPQPASYDVQHGLGSAVTARRFNMKLLKERRRVDGKVRAPSNNRTSGAQKKWRNDKTKMAFMIIAIQLAH